MIIALPGRLLNSLPEHQARNCIFAKGQLQLQQIQLAAENIGIMSGYKINERL